MVFTTLDRDDAEDGADAPELVSAAPGPEQVVAQREALLMQLEGGLSLEEIAAATGQGFETIKSRLRYAFAKVREGMKGHV